MANITGTGANAPAGMRPGDTYTNNSGTYTITTPGQPGSNFNKDTGYWSISNKDVVGQLGTSNMNTNNIMSNAAKIANSISAESSAKQYKFNSEEAQKLRDWQERMSNTAHQREVQDLIKAGLNPVLSLQGGNGSTTPSGASASGGSYQGQRADVEPVTAVLASILGTMLNNQNARDIAQIQKDAMIQGASISSAASMYGSDMNYRLGLETRNPFWKLGNEALDGNNSGKVVSRLKNISGWIHSKIGGMMDRSDNTYNNMKNPLKDK